MAEIVRLETKQLSFDEMLEQFWQSYPFKGREKKLWVKRALGKALHEDDFNTIMTGLERYKESEKVLAGYVLGAQNFLSSGSWMDEGPPPKREVTPDERLKNKAWFVAKLIRTTSTCITDGDLREMVEKSLITQEQADRW